MYVNELVRAAAENIGEGEDLPLAVLPAAIPYFSVRLSALCVEKRELDVLQEFVLRAVGLGLVDGLSIAGFLGARPEEVDHELSRLSEEYFVSRSDTPCNYVLTEKGIGAISQTGLRRITEREVACYVNGVTRRIEQVSEMLIPRRRVPQDSVILPAVPARSPKIDELDVTGVRTAMVVSRASLPRALEISRLGRVLRTSRLFLGGHLLLKRGGHSAPVICVHGSPNSDLAKILGAHPAIQTIKTDIEADERRARSFIRNRASKLLNIRLAASGVLREALTKFVAYADADPKTHTQCESQFASAAEPLLGTTHWITSVEWHILFAKLTLTATQRLLILMPPHSALFDLDQLESLGGLGRRGVDVELLMNHEDAALLQRDDRLRAVLGAVRVVAVPAIGVAFGYCCDRQYLVVGVTQARSSTMGQYHTFFGAFISNAADPEKLLLSWAESAEESNEERDG